MRNRDFIFIALLISQSVSFIVFISEHNLRKYYERQANAVVNRIDKDTNAMPPISDMSHDSLLYYSGMTNQILSINNAMIQAK